MPKTVTQSSLMAELGERGRKAHDTHKTDETVYGMINLPEGISGGVAQLTTAKWDRYKTGKLQGKPYVLLRGIAKIPTEHNGTPVAGQGVMQMIPLCDTPDRKIRSEPGTLENWYAYLLNEFRLLGIDTSDMGFDDIEPTLAALEQQKPHYNFSTRGFTPKKTAANPNPNRMVFTQFDGYCEFSDNGEAASSDIKDETPEAPEEAPDSGAEPATDLPDDIDELLAIAEDDDSPVQADAQTKLREIAVDMGVPQETVDDENLTWTGLADLIKQAAEAPAEAEPEVPPDPAVGDCFKYQPLDAKGKPALDAKKKPIKPFDVEVLTVSARNRTVTLKSLITKKPITGADKKPLNIKWTSLLPA